MVGLQYLFLEPNADDPLNKGEFNNTIWLWHIQFSDQLPLFAEAAEDLRRDREQFLANVKSSLKGGYVKGVSYDKVSV
jgi:ubiquitin-conjugating enzyme E2 M